MPNDLRAPDFLIIGEMKCGTSTLWELLGRHPSVFCPEEKELHFFSSYTDFPQHGRLETVGIEPYLKHFGGTGPDQICGEATPNYLFDEGACQRIRSVVPDVRLIAILRDPVRRAWSHYWHQVRRGWERLSFEEALEAEEDRLASGDANTRDRYSYIARGRYIERLSRYEKVFPREQLCVVLLEDLQRDPVAVMDRVRGHLGLAQPFRLAELDLPEANRASFPKWPRLDALSRVVSRWARARGPAAVSTVKAIGNLTRALRVYSGAPRMSETLRSELHRAFNESDRKLRNWLGRPLPWD